MSKLIKEIKAYQTGEAYAEYSPLTFKSSYKEFPQGYSGEYSYKYDISATLGCYAIVRQDQLQFAKDRVRKEVAEYVFGEYRPMLIEISRAAYNRDFDKVMQKVIEIEESMFGGE